jgi:hypothetical protein
MKTKRFLPDPDVCLRTKPMSHATKEHEEGGRHRTWAALARSLSHGSQMTSCSTPPRCSFVWTATCHLSVVTLLQWQHSSTEFYASLCMLLTAQHDLNLLHLKVYIPNLNIIPPFPAWVSTWRPHRNAASVHLNLILIWNNLLHGAEPFLRSGQLWSYSRTSQHSVGSEHSLPCSKEPSISPCPVPDQSSPYHPILSL